MKCEYSVRHENTTIFMTYEDVSGTTRGSVPEFGRDSSLSKIRRHSLSTKLGHEYSEIVRLKQGLTKYATADTNRITVAV